MLIRQGSSGLPFTCTRTGSGRRQPSFSVLARAALTWTYGLTPTISILARKRSAGMVTILRSPSHGTYPLGMRYLVRRTPTLLAPSATLPGRDLPVAGGLVHDI